MSVARSFYFTDGKQLQDKTVTNPSPNIEVLSMAVGFREDMEVSVEAAKALIEMQSRPSTVIGTPRAVEIGDLNIFRRGSVS